MEIGTVSLGNVACTMWVPKSFRNQGFEGKVRYLLLGKIIVLVHPSATKEEVLKSLLACTQQLRGGELYV